MVDRADRQRAGGAGEDAPTTDLHVAIEVGLDDEPVLRLHDDVVLEPQRELVDHAVQYVEWTEIRSGQPSLGRGTVAFDRGLQHRPCQVLLGVEVEVHRTLGRARSFQDPVQRCRGIAALPEFDGGGPDNRRPCPAGPLLLPCHARNASEATHRQSKPPVGLDPWRTVNKGKYLKPGFSRKFGPEVRKLENSVKHTSWYNFSARVRRRGCAPGRTYVSDLSRISLLRHRLLDCHNRTGRSQHLRAPR
ncbi:Uncharacterised protein [Mycobacteroides abscessus subsp. abscessus]|nr:Uncharacterised protein [Mycobacteroides abscessus subsp. abscessus]